MSGTSPTPPQRSSLKKRLYSVASGIQSKMQLKTYGKSRSKKVKVGPEWTGGPVPQTTILTSPINQPQLPKAKRTPLPSATIPSSTANRSQPAKTKRTPLPPTTISFSTTEQLLLAKGIPGYPTITDFNTRTSKSGSTPTNSSPTTVNLNPPTSRSISTSSASFLEIINSRPATTFHKFLKLPTELQEHIWRQAIVTTRSRIIIWRSPSIPPLLHACAKSRALFLQENRVENWRTGSLRKEMLFVNWEHNLVFFKGRVPGLASWDEAPNRDEKPVRELKRWAPHIQSTPQIGGRWLEEIRLMALSSSVVEDFVKDQGRGENGWVVLARLCPNLKNLIILSESGRMFMVGDTLERLSKIHYLRTVNNSRNLRWVRDIRVAFNAVRVTGLLSDLKLCFMEVRYRGG